jgi:hypothetical protein
MISAIVGVISTFLPLITISIGGRSVSASVLQDTRGVLCLLCYAAIIALSFFLYQQSSAQNQRGLLYGVLAAAGVAILLALLLLIDAMRVSVGIGTILNFLAAIGVGVGAFMKAKEDRLF